MDEERKFYTYRELAEALNTSDFIARKKIEKTHKDKFKTEKQHVNGTLQAVVYLSIEEIEAIKHEIAYNKSRWSKKESINNQSSINHPAINEQPENKEEINERGIAYIENLTNQLIIAKDEASDLREKFALIEDKKKNQDKEINRLTIDNKSLNYQLKKRHWIYLGIAILTLITTTTIAINRFNAIIVDNQKILESKETALTQSQSVIKEKEKIIQKKESRIKELQKKVKK